MKKKSLTIWMVVVVFVFSGVWAVANCLSADLTDDCFVDFNDFAVMASQCLTMGIPNDPCNLMWVDINDPGVLREKSLAFGLTLTYTTY